MTRIKINTLIWDDFNEKHIKKHGVTKLEIEKSSNKVLYHKQTYGNRYLVVCKGEKRTITIIISRKSSTTYYVISARTSSKSERKKINDKK